MLNQNRQGKLRLSQDHLNLIQNGKSTKSSIKAKIAKYKSRDTIIMGECNVNIRVSIKWVPTLDAIVLYLR